MMIVSDQKNSHREPLLTDLLVYVTEYCNLKCQHCYYEPVHYNGNNKTGLAELSYEQLCRAIDELLPFGLCACKLSGGEPFIRKDLIDICYHLDSRGVRVLIETNGTLISEDNAKALAGLKGDTFISVSIDGADAATHEWFRGVSGCYDIAMHGLENLVRNGLQVQVITSLFTRNQKQLPKLIEMCKAKGVRSFKLNIINPIGRAKRLSQIDLADILIIDKQLAELSQRIGIRYCSPLPPALLGVRNIIKSCALQGRCSINSTIGILHDGTITTCGMGRHAGDFRYGMLDKDSIAEVWSENPTLKKIRTEIPSKLRGICGRCIFRSQCLGHCRLNNEEVKESGLCDPFWICREMDKRGLFPTSRVYEHIDINSRRCSAKEKTYVVK